MRVLVTGGAGFIGRWVVARLLRESHRVVVVDDLSNGSRANLGEFATHPAFEVVEGNVSDAALVDRVFRDGVDRCYHLAAQVNVQKSIDDPARTVEPDVLGVLRLLGAARRKCTRFVFVSTCMVYAACDSEAGIDELHPVSPASPYAATKLAGEQLTLAYHATYGLPTTVVRPFNTYGPFQKTSAEGGVVAIFISRALAGEPLLVYGDGTQTRDLLYVEDCAAFIVRAGEVDATVGVVVNGGLGQDVAVNALAARISRGRVPIRHVPHIHPQSEIMRLRARTALAARIMEWKPAVSLEEGLARTEAWIAVSR
jgi:nucleoside-diphosphate-sugar epimerase